MPTVQEQLKKMFEGFEYDEARHARPVENPNPDEEPEESFTDFINRKISNLQTTIEELKTAIDREQESIKAGSIGTVNGMEKINSWQSRLNATQFKVQMLKKALEAYMDDQSADNEYKLKMAALKN